MALTGPRQKFAEGIAQGLSQAEAYRAAYPKCSRAAAASNSPRLMGNDGVQAEIKRIRRAAEVLMGGCVLTLAMKRQFLYEVVTTAPGTITEKSHLCQEFTRSRAASGGRIDAGEWVTEKVKLPDKIRAILADNDLAGESADTALAITITQAWAADVK